MNFLLPLSITAFYMGAGNTILARFAGTCTHGDAGRLYGVVISAVLFFVALAIMKASARERSVVLFILPVLPVLVWQAWFSLRLSFEILVWGHSACDVLQGEPSSFPVSGSELFFSIAWPLMSFSVLLGLVVLWIGRSGPAKTGQ